MTGPELKAIRNRLGLSSTALGRAFGYEGTDVTVSGTIRKFESGDRAIPSWIGRLAIMLDRHGVPPEWIEGAPAPQKPGRKPIVIDKEVLRRLADLDVDKKGRLK